MKRLFPIAGAVLLLLVSACGIYSFSGTSIQSDVKTVTIDLAVYKAPRVNPSLAISFTEELKNKFRRLTRLEQVEEDGDLEITTEIVGYDVRATAVTAQEIAAQNRLTVTVRASFSNRKYPEDNFENKTFSAYADYDSNNSLDAVESSLCVEIIEKLVEDIFNASVAQW